MDSNVSQNNWPDAALEKDLINYFFFGSQVPVQKIIFSFPINNLTLQSANQNKPKNQLASVKNGENPEIALARLQKLQMWIMEVKLTCFSGFFNES